MTVPYTGAWSPDDGCMHLAPYRAGRMTLCGIAMPEQYGDAGWDVIRGPVTAENFRKFSRTHRTNPKFNQCPGCLAKLGEEGV